MASVFQNIKVLEISTSITGQYLAMLLGDLGAEVIKVEGPEDKPLRSNPSFPVLNRGKRSIELDFGYPKTREIVDRLIAKCDVLLVDFHSPRFRDYIQDYDSVQRKNGGLVLCSISPWGESGPYAYKQGSGKLVAAYCGYALSQASFTNNPVYTVMPYIEYRAAIIGACGVVAALLHREHTGLGQKLELSLLVEGGLGDLWGDTVNNTIGQLATPFGHSPTYRIYPTKDGWIQIAAGNTTFCRQLFTVIGEEQLFSNPRFLNVPWGITSIEDRETLERIIGDWVRHYTNEEVLAILERKDVPCGLVRTVEEFARHPQVLHSNMIIELDDPNVGKVRQMGILVILSDTPGKIQGPCPLLGQHTQEILCEIGYSDTQIHNLQSSTTSLETRRGDMEHQQAKQRNRMKVEIARILEGIKVLDFTTALAGSLGPKLLADLGADVIKIESLEGDPFRSRAGNFIAWNSGKRSIVIDLHHERGRQIIYKMVKQSDVVAENFRPMTTERLGIEYRKLRAINPKLVYSSVSAWGDTGPYSNRPGYDAVLQAESGIMDNQGRGQETPMDLSHAEVDVATALLHTFSILSALYARQRTGIGQHVKTSLMSGALAVQPDTFIFYDGMREPIIAGKGYLGPTATEHFYKTQDRWIFIECKDEAFWGKLCQAIGKPEMKDDERFRSASRRRENNEALVSILENTFSKRTSSEWLAQLDQAGVPCAPVNSHEEIPRQAQIAAGDLIGEHYEPLIGGYLQHLKTRFRLSETPGALLRPAPLLGEHTNEVLTALAYSSNDIEELRRLRIIR